MLPFSLFLFKYFNIPVNVRLTLQRTWLLSQLHVFTIKGIDLSLFHQMQIFYQNGFEGTCYFSVDWYKIISADFVFVLWALRKHACFFSCWYALASYTKLQLIISSMYDSKINTLHSTYMSAIHKKIIWGPVEHLLNVSPDNKIVCIKKKLQLSTRRKQ